MKRRTFVLSIGFAAGAGSAVLGSGAFTSVSADRDVDVNVAGDADSFLRIAPTEDPNGAYARGASDGAMYLDFTGENDGVDGSGFNPESVTGMSKVFEIANQGTQDVSMTIEPGTGTHATAILPQDVDAPGDQDVLLVITAHNPDDPFGDVVLSPGEKKKFSATAAVSSAIGGASAIEQDEITIKAEAI